jgi:hypothetical protein
MKKDRNREFSDFYGSYSLIHFLLGKIMENFTDSIFSFEENDDEIQVSQKLDISPTMGRRSEIQRRRDFEIVSEIAKNLSSLPSLQTSFSPAGKVLVDRQVEKVFMECLRGLFIEGQTVVERLRKKKQSGVCGAIWKKGKMAYQCRDCQITPKSFICVDCFVAGDHQGHDFILHVSNEGGCCDCGNASTWNPQGFCSRHNGIASQSNVVASSPVFSTFQTGSPISSSPAFISFPVSMNPNAATLSSPAKDIIRLLMEHLTLHLDAVLEERR